MNPILVTVPTVKQILPSVKCIPNWQKQVGLDSYITEAHTYFAVCAVSNTFSTCLSKLAYLVDQCTYCDVNPEASQALGMGRQCCPSSIVPRLSQLDLVLFPIVIWKIKIRM